MFATYRFARKLRENRELFDDRVDGVLAALRRSIPGMGETVSIDGSDLPACSDGQRYLYKGGPERTKFSDPDATWGHRSSISTRKGGGFFGFKVHAVVDTVTELPIAWRVATASASEPPFVSGLLDELERRSFPVGIAVADKGYDRSDMYDCWRAATSGR